MAKLAGRKVLLYSGTSPSGTLVAGGREHGIKINNESIDVTDKGDAGWRTLLEESGVRSVDIDFGGLMDTSTLISLSLGSDATAMLAAYYVDIEGLGIIAGDFRLNGIEIGSPHDGATEMSGTLQSSGAITWTADT